MIRISVHLIAHSTGKVTELARMDICNDDTGTMMRRNYNGVAYRGRNKGFLDRMKPQRIGRVTEWASEAYHVWYLVAAMLHSMGYRPKSTASVTAASGDTKDLSLSTSTT